MRRASSVGISWRRRRAVEAALVASAFAHASPTAVAQSSTPQRAELVLQTGHTASIKALVLSPDGRFLVSGSEDVTLKIWDTATGNVLRTLYGHEQPVLAAAISPDGRLIASGGADTTVRVWNVVTGQATTLGSHTSAVKNLAFSDDGRQLTSLGNNEAKVYDLVGGREVTTVRLANESGAMAQAMAAASVDQVATAVSPNGRLVAIGSTISDRYACFTIPSAVSQ